MQTEASGMKKGIKRASKTLYGVRIQKTYWVFLGRILKMIENGISNMLK